VGGGAAVPHGPRQPGDARREPHGRRAARVHLCGALPHRARAARAEAGAGRPPTGHLQQRVQLQRRKGGVPRVRGGRGRGGQQRARAAGRGHLPHPRPGRHGALLREPGRQRGRVEAAAGELGWRSPWQEGQAFEGASGGPKRVSRAAAQVLVCGPTRLDPAKFLGQYIPGRCSIAETLVFDPAKPARVMLFPRPGRPGGAGGSVRSTGRPPAPRCAACEGGDQRGAHLGSLASPGSSNRLRQCRPNLGCGAANAPGVRLVLEERTPKAALLLLLPHLPDSCTDPTSPSTTRLLCWDATTRRPAAALPGRAADLHVSPRKCLRGRRRAGAAPHSVPPHPNTRPCASATRPAVRSARLSPSSRALPTPLPPQPPPFPPRPPRARRWCWTRSRGTAWT
jgi:hypothetical protein